MTTRRSTTADRDTRRIERPEAPLPREALDAIAALPGVLGVFPGIRRRDGQFGNEPVITVHVRRKLPRSELDRSARIPDDVGGVPTDVIAVGRPKLHAAVDSSDRLVENFDPWRRQSAISAFAQDDSGAVLALGSGHGLLRIRDGSYQSGAFPESAGLSVFVDSDPADTGGHLTQGAVDPHLDFAIARFSTLRPPLALLGHTLSALPVPLRFGNIEGGETVQHVPPNRGRVTGTVTGGLARVPVEFRSTDGIMLSFADVFTVAGSAGRFSKDGDSGSIVFDGERRAVGFVVGGGVDPDNTNLAVTYVLRNFGALKQAMGPAFPLFFGDA